TQRNEPGGVVVGPPGQPTYGVVVQVIVVIVGDEHRVQRRQFVRRHARGGEAAWTEGRQRRRAVAELRVRQQVEAADLEQKGRVPEPGGGQLCRRGPRAARIGRGAG